MAKYMKLVSLMLAALFAITITTVLTKDKLSGLRATQSATPVAFTSLKDRERQLRCMADNIYFEAGSESAEGKIAVAQVVMNRVDDPRFPKDPCQVIYQKNVVYERVICQFSWYCEGPAYRRVRDQERWNESYDAAKMVLLEGFRLPSLRDALYYHADYVNPRWGKPQVGKIGRHIFYKERI